MANSLEIKASPKNTQTGLQKALISSQAFHLRFYRIALPQENQKLQEEILDGNSG